MTAKIITRDSLSNLQTTPKALPQRVAAKLFTFGGDKVVWQDDPHASELLKRGQLCDLPVKMRKGQPNRCHTTAAAIWGLDTTRYRLMTGYGLSEDGVWRCHSWVVDVRHLYETTVPRRQYFGVALDPQQSANFWLNYFLMAEYAEPVQILGLLGPPSSACSCEVCRAEHGGAAA